MKKGLIALAVAVIAQIVASVASLADTIQLLF